MTFHFCLSLGNMLLLTTSSVLCIQTVPLVMQTSWHGNTAVHGMQRHDLKNWQPGDRKREKVLNLSTLHSLSIPLLSKSDYWVKPKSLQHVVSPEAMIQSSVVYRGKACQVLATQETFENFRNSDVFSLGNSVAWCCWDAFEYSHTMVVT